MTEWSTAVGRVDEGTIEVRGYPLSEIIGGMSFAQAVYLTIRGEVPSTAHVRVLDAALCAILEHAFYSPTTLAARMVTSTTPDTIMPGLAAGLLTIGSVTVSPQHTAELIGRVRAELESGCSLAEAGERVATRLLDEGRRMPGLGHPLHPEGDPRAVALEKVTRDAGLWGGAGEAFEAVRTVYVERIGKSLPTNIDGMLGCVLTDIGFQAREMPGIAAISFLPGLIAHTVEEASQPPRLRTAVGHYVGPPTQHLDGHRSDGG